ncbi:MAG: cysteine--tRNA ligase [Deltaproteobacteria bacterium]|nr:MAG: cysteine--tRNA ligase [Deltaproteobacteria bacterium]
MKLKIYNTLGKRVEEFRPLKPDRVRIYSCGPTVYRYAHIGNFRTFLLSDLLVRTLRALGYETFHVQNITDVGHMRQEMLERGEDRVVAEARRMGKTPREIADFYTEAFLRDCERMNFLPADLYPRASEHVEDMVSIIEKIVERGYTYERDGTIYFDVEKDPEYGTLSGNLPGELVEGHRVEVDRAKKRPEDFTLWKSAEPGREMKWASPWGEGFPGWHIECVAMAVKYLGPDFDFHLGGIDLVFPHHENEMAQARAGLGAGLARYWVHGGHLLVEGKKMAKSAGNVYTLDDLEERGFSPLDFRYLCFTAHYRTVFNFTFDALEGARRARNRLTSFVERMRDRGISPAGLSPEGERAREEFLREVASDLNLPGALSVLWKAFRSDIPDGEKLSLLLEWDRVLGVGIADSYTRAKSDVEIPPEVRALAEERAQAKREKDYVRADSLREEIKKRGFLIVDTKDGYELKKLR